MAAIKRDIGKEILKLVDMMHEEKKISRDIIFGGIESEERAISIQKSTGQDPLLYALERTNSISP